jgi:hypothetical protein
MMMGIEREKYTWSRSEDVIMERAFRRGEPIAEIAKRHRRSDQSIEERLIKRGLMLTTRYRTSPEEKIRRQFEVWYREWCNQQGILEEDPCEHKDDPECNEIDQRGELEPDLSDEEWIENLRSQIQGYSDDLPPMYKEDWCDKFDDFDGADWEYYMGGTRL